MNLQHLGCWNHLEKLAEMFLNTFHREHILLVSKIKKLLRKIKSKNLTAGVFFFSCLMKVERIAECSLQYFWPALSDNPFFKTNFGLFESGRFTLVLLY